MGLSPTTSYRTVMCQRVVVWLGCPLCGCMSASADVLEGKHGVLGGWLRGEQCAV